MNASRCEDPHRKAYRDARHRFYPVETGDDPFPRLLEQLHAAESVTRTADKTALSTTTENDTDPL